MPRRKFRHGPSPSIKRRGPVKEPKPVVHIVCEGKRSEPEYFTGLFHSNNEDKIIANCIPGAGVPTSVVSKAITMAKKAKEHPRDSFEEKDQVWAVFDCDDHPQLNEAINDAEQNGVRVALSNPCFELWLLLHFSEYDAPNNRGMVQRIYRDNLPHGYSKPKTIIFDHFKAHVRTAEGRAERMLKRRSQEGSPNGNPSTGVFRLTKVIRGA